MWCNDDDDAADNDEADCVECFASNNPAAEISPGAAIPFKLVMELDEVVEELDGVVEDELLLLLLLLLLEDLLSVSSFTRTGTDILRGEGADCGNTRRILVSIYT